MSFRWMAAGLVALAPTLASAFETVDTLPWPSSGRFPAWQGDPVRPWSVFAYGGLMYDSNPFRRETDEESDMVARLGAGGRTQGRLVGRQRYTLEGYGEYYDYNHLSAIDHFGYGARGELNWELGNDVNGDLSYSRVRRHADLGEFQREERVMILEQRYLLDGGWRFLPNWRISGGLERNTADRDSEDAADTEVNTARGRLIYATPLGNSIGVEARGTRGQARFIDELNGIDTTDDYEERELALIAVYRLGEQLRTFGRIGHTEREYKDLQERNFSGGTWRAQVDWLPTAKLTFTFETYRDVDSTLDASASHVLRDGEAFGIAYAATFKLVFTARFTNERRLYQGDASAVVLGLPQRDDTLRVWRFGAGWEPQRHWQVGVGLDIGERTSNLLGAGYDYTAVMGNVRWTF
jgi:hypothetical protein